MVVGQWYYAKNVVEKTVQRVLYQDQHVSSVEIKKEKDEIVIYLTLKDVDNLMAVYLKIQDIIERQLKTQPFKLKIVNNISPIIKDLYYDEIQFIIYEALQTGEFTQMKAQLDKIQYMESQITPKPVEIKVFIDVENLYLQIKSNEYTLYEVIKRE